MLKYILGVGIVLCVAAGAYFFVFHWNEPVQKYVKGCVADNGSVAYCECSASAMKSNFSKTEFAQLAGIARRGDDQAGEIFMSDQARLYPDKMKSYVKSMSSCAALQN